MKKRSIAYLGLGSNLGDRQAFLEQAIFFLKQTSGIDVLKLSSIYETTPVEYEEQPNFLNLVVKIQTGYPPLELLEVLLDIERKMKRVRTVRYGPRTIDLDLLLYDDVTMEHPKLQLPHPRMCQRRFVLVPLYEIEPNLMIPSSGFSLAELIDRLPQDQQVKKIGRIELE
jgi:2-amino-4-hydroxy-6-hydroxymethyldihydropteridine diphosphokinase